MCFCVDLNRDCVKLKILVNWELPLWRLSLVHRLENHRSEKQRPLMRATFFYENIFLIELRSLRKYFHKKSKTPVGFCFSERFKRGEGGIRTSHIIHYLSHIQGCSLKKWHFSGILSASYLPIREALTAPFLNPFFRGRHCVSF